MADKIAEERSCVDSTVRGFHICKELRGCLVSHSRAKTIVCSHLLDTLFIDNNSPMQWSIKMNFVPLGSPLKSAKDKEVMRL